MGLCQKNKRAETCEHKERMQLTKPMTLKTETNNKKYFRTIVNPLYYTGNDKGGNASLRKMSIKRTEFCTLEHQPVY